MRLILALAALVALCLPANASERQFDVAGHRVILVSPERLADRPAPLLLALHGGGGNAAQFRRASGFDAEARRAGFRVAYVDGSPLGRAGRAFTWNAGGCCGPAVRRGDDDLGALEQVIAALRGVTRGPVWIAGHSNGAMMAYRMACESRAPIGGIVAISGSLMVDRCPAARGVEVLHIHGSDDRNVPFAGGRGPDSRAGVAFRGVEASLAILARNGADTGLLVIDGAGHKLSALNAATRAQTGQSIGALVAGRVTQP